MKSATDGAGCSSVPLRLVADDIGNGPSCFPVAALRCGATSTRHQMAVVMQIDGRADPEDYASERSFGGSSLQPGATREDPVPPGVWLLDCLAGWGSQHLLFTNFVAPQSPAWAVQPAVAQQQHATSEQMGIGVASEVMRCSKDKAWSI